MRLNERIAKLEASAPLRRMLPKIPREHAVVLGLASEAGYMKNLERFPDVREMLQRIEVMTVDEWVSVSRILRDVMANELPLDSGWSPGESAASRAQHARNDLADG